MNRLTDYILGFSLPVGSLQGIQMPTFSWHYVINFKDVNNIGSKGHHCHVWLSNNKQLRNVLYSESKKSPLLLFCDRKLQTTNHKLDLNLKS